MYNFERKELKNGSIITSLEDAVCSLTPKGPLKLTMEAYETFDQNEKELAVVDLMWPEFEEFESVCAYDGTPSVHCQTIRGKPDYIFVMLEHVYDNYGANTGNNPTVETLKFEHWGEELKCISELDKIALYHLTRRNSHIHADVANNYKKIGAVLLTKQDAMDFPQWKGVDGIDQFPLDITVTSFREPVPDSRKDIRLKVYFIYTGFSLQGKLYEAKFRYN